MSVYDYLVNNGLDETDFDVLSVLEDITDYVKQNYINEPYPLAPNEVMLKKPLPNLKISLNYPVPDYILTVVCTYGLNNYEPYVDITDVPEIEYSWVVPYDNEKESYIFIITQRPFSEFIDDPSLFETEFLVAFGSTFLPIEIEEGEQAEEGEPPELIVNPDSTQSIRVLNGTTLEEYSIVPDVYDVRISQKINGPYTLNFKLLPYVNASNIYTPRIVECDGDYFHVQRITKRRQLQNLEMQVECEHVSYELNIPPHRFWDAEQKKYTWTEDTYKGTAEEIIWEMLYGSRFNLTSNLGNTEYTFTTRAEGFRSRINEFAAFIGREVKWTKFNISLLERRGHDNGVKLEVGKNIIGLVEYIDTVKLGRVQRSYDIDVLDLNYVTDELENPLELHNIVLGDTLHLIDGNYLINRSDRVVAIEYDPFKRALPTLELSNGVASFTSDSSNYAVQSGSNSGSFKVANVYHSSGYLFYTSNNIDVTMELDKRYHFKAGSMIHGSMILCVKCTRLGEVKEYHEPFDNIHLTGEVMIYTGPNSPQYVPFYINVPLGKAYVLNLPLNFMCTDDYYVQDVYLDIEHLFDGYKSDYEYEVEFDFTPYMSADGGSHNGLQMFLQIPTTHTTNRAYEIVYV